MTLAKCCPDRYCWSDNRRLKEMEDRDHVGAYGPGSHCWVAGWLGNENHTYILRTASGLPYKPDRSDGGIRDIEIAYFQMSHPQYNVSLSSTGPVVQCQMAHSHWSDLARGGTSVGLGPLAHPYRPTA